MISTELQTYKKKKVSLKKLIILVDNKSDFQISKPDFKNFRSMDVDRIKDYFTGKGFIVELKKFYELDPAEDFQGIYILYQTSEAPGSFYKRYIEDLIFHLEKGGAVVLPCYEYLKAHHNKVYMELLRTRFKDNSLKTVKCRCFGSWEDALNFQPGFPVVIKQASSSGGAGVFLARNGNDYSKYIKRAGRIVTSRNAPDLVRGYLKIAAKKFIKFLYPSKSGFVEYDTTPVSNPLIVQEYIDGLTGDYKVLVFDCKFYTMFRKNRDNDFRASGSGRFYEVAQKEQEGLLDFARRITFEINFPIIGMDIGFDGKNYHLLEYQMIHYGTSALQRSKFWYEYHEGKWLRFDGESNLEEEFSRSIYNYLKSTG